MSLIKLSNGVEISEETVVAALEKAGIETKPKEPVFGDIVTVSGYATRRIILYDKSGKLVGIGRNGNKMGGIIPHQYLPTGQNIFTDNILNLDN